MGGAVGMGCSFKRWPAIWQWWPLHYQQLICQFAREGLEYTPLPTVPPNGRVGDVQGQMRSFHKVWPIYFALAEADAAE
jgi:hypothetical protein